MGSLKRKIARNKEKKLNKKMRKQISMFGQLENECATCQEPFDKKSKEHVKTWRVVIREKEEVVRLYCPGCWERTIELIEEIKNDFRVQIEDGGDEAPKSEP